MRPENDSDFFRRHRPNQDILVAEDNRTNQLVVAKMLETRHCRVSFAGDRQEAVQFFEASQPDLILMDWSMSEMDGLEAARQIHNHEKTRDYPQLQLLPSPET